MHAKSSMLPKEASRAPEMYSEPRDVWKLDELQPMTTQTPWAETEK